MKNKWVVVLVSFRLGDCFVYGPYSTEEEALKTCSRIEHDYTKEVESTSSDDSLFYVKEMQVPYCPYCHTPVENSTAVNGISPIRGNGCEFCNPQVV